MNDSLQQIADTLLSGERIYLFPHENPDGDAVGSTAALCSMLRGMGKEAWVLIDEKLPDNLRFMEDGFFMMPDGEIEAPDISAAVDCSLVSRFPKLADIFNSGRTKICIDHHMNNEPCGDLNYVDSETAAAGELVFMLMDLIGHEPTKKEAEDLFAAITTDTGNFLYSNTTKQSHEIVSRLFDAGINVQAVGAEIYENVAPKKFMLDAVALSETKLYYDSRVAATAVTQDMLDKTGAVMSDAEPVVADLRKIEGVEIAICFKQRGPEKIFVSMRSKTSANVRIIAEAFGGGGHEKAAGCTLNMPLSEAMEKVLAKAGEALQE